MKENIDLTRTRAFSSDWNETNSPSRKRFPWHFLQRGLRACSGVMCTGNKEQIAWKRLYTSYGKICECCGTSLDRIPWHHNTGLCEKCSTRLERECGRPSMFILDKKVARMFANRNKVNLII